MRICLAARGTFSAEWKKEKKRKEDKRTKQTNFFFLSQSSYFARVKRRIQSDEPSIVTRSTVSPISTCFSRLYRCNVSLEKKKKRKERERERKREPADTIASRNTARTIRFVMRARETRTRLRVRTRKRNKYVCTAVNSGGAAKRIAFAKLMPTPITGRQP